MINRKNANLSYLSDLPNGAQRKESSSLCLCKRWHLLPQHCCQWAELQTEAADPTRTWIPLHPWSSSLGTHKTKTLSLHLLFVTLGWKPLIRTKICDSHTYESHPILFEPSFSSALFENYADKTNPTQSGTVMSIMSMIFVAFSKTQISTHSHMWCFYPHRF